MSAQTPIKMSAGSIFDRLKNYANNTKQSTTGQLGTVSDASDLPEPEKFSHDRGLELLFGSTQVKTGPSGSTGTAEVDGIDPNHESLVRLKRRLANSSADEVLTSLGFSGSGSFLPKRFAENWFDKILEGESESVDSVEGEHTSTRSAADNKESRLKTGDEILQRSRRISSMHESKMSAFRRSRLHGHNTISNFPENPFAFSDQGICYGADAIFKRFTQNIRQSSLPIDFDKNFYGTKTTTEEDNNKFIKRQNKENITSLADEKTVSNANSEEPPKRDELSSLNDTNASVKSSDVLQSKTSDVKSSVDSDEANISVCNSVDSIVDSSIIMKILNMNISTSNSSNSHFDEKGNLALNGDDNINQRLNKDTDQSPSINKSQMLLVQEQNDEINGIHDFQNDLNFVVSRINKEAQTDDRTLSPIIFFDSCEDHSESFNHEADSSIHSDAEETDSVNGKSEGAARNDSNTEDEEEEDCFLNNESCLEHKQPSEHLCSSRGSSPECDAGINTIYWSGLLCNRCTSVVKSRFPGTINEGTRSNEHYFLILDKSESKGESNTNANVVNNESQTEYLNTYKENKGRHSIKRNRSIGSRQKFFNRSRLSMTAKGNRKRVRKRIFSVFHLKSCEPPDQGILTTDWIEADVLQDEFHHETPAKQFTTLRPKYSQLTDYGNEILLGVSRVESIDSRYSTPFGVDSPDSKRPLKISIWDSFCEPPDRAAIDCYSMREWACIGDVIKALSSTAVTTVLVQNQLISNAPSSDSLLCEDNLNAESIHLDAVNDYRELLETFPFTLTNAFDDDFSTNSESYHRCWFRIQNSVKHLYEVEDSEIIGGCWFASGSEDVEFPFDEESHSLEHCESSTFPVCQNAEDNSEFYTDSTPLDVTRVSMDDPENKDELNKNELNKNELNKDKLNKSELNKSELNKNELNKDELNKDELSKNELNKSELNKNESPFKKLEKALDSDFTPLRPTEWNNDREMNSRDVTQNEIYFNGRPNYTLDSRDHLSKGDSQHKCEFSTNSASHHTNIEGDGRVLRSGSVERFCKFFETIAANGDDTSSFETNALKHGDEDTVNIQIDATAHSRPETDSAAAMNGVDDGEQLECEANGYLRGNVLRKIRHFEEQITENVFGMRLSVERNENEHNEQTTNRNIKSPFESKYCEHVKQDEENQRNIVQDNKPDTKTTTQKASHSDLKQLHALNSAASCKCPINDTGNTCTCSDEHTCNMRGNATLITGISNSNSSCVNGTNDNIDEDNLKVCDNDRSMQIIQDQRCHQHDFLSAPITSNSVSLYNTIAGDILVNLRTRLEAKLMESCCHATNGTHPLVRGPSPLVSFTKNDLEVIVQKAVDDSFEKFL